jgi:hypothetical protein
MWLGFAGMIAGLIRMITLSIHFNWWWFLGIGFGFFLRRYTLSINQGKFKCSTFFIRGNWYPSVVVDRGDILIFNTNYNTKMLSRDTIILKGILKNFDEIVEKINVSLITAK